MTVELSLNEVETLAAKAARGGGLAWGLAEDVGRAARWLARFGLPWAGSLPRVLADERACGTPNSVGFVLAAEDGRNLSPLVSGAHLLDRAADLAIAPIQLLRVGSPLWLLPFAAQAADQLGRPVAVHIGPSGAKVARHCCVIDPDCVPALRAPAPVDVHCALTDAAGEARSAPALRRAVIPIAAYRTLEDFAGRTYVPASAASRALGAGAGETDND